MGCNSEHIIYLDCLNCLQQWYFPQVLEIKELGYLASLFYLASENFICC